MFRNVFGRWSAGRMALTSALTPALACLACRGAIAFAAPPAPPAVDARPPTKEFSAVYPHAAVAADHAVASQAGLDMLRAGGNAVDAAVAASFTLSVVRPYSCGIGGGGFMVVYLPNDPTHGRVLTTLDYRETAIAAMTPEYYDKPPVSLDPDAATHGGRAVAVPGTVAGLLHALETWGTMPRPRVLEPAIRAAEHGFRADAHYVESSREVIDWIRAHPGAERRFAFLWERVLGRGGVKVGDEIRVPEQARALRMIAQHGAKAFYDGDIAEAVVRAARADAGELTLADLAAYRVKTREPFVARYRDRTILTMPPPSSGGIVLAQVFGMLDARRDDLDAAVREGHTSPAYVHLVSEACKHAFADRARWLGDTDFVDVPLATLLSPDYIRARAAEIRLDRTLASDDYGGDAPPPPPPDDHGTSHLCVIDPHGGAVACTETINLYFGSCVAVPEYGFFLNNEMDDFQARLGHANAFDLKHATRNRPAPGKRPLSSMTPTIITRTDANQTPGDVLLIAGGSGGPRIISGTLQACLDVLLFDMDAGHALAAPRFHHQWLPDSLDLEPALRGGMLESRLRALGHTIGERKAVGAVQLIRASPDGWQAASDPRKGGTPSGY